MNAYLARSVLASASRSRCLSTSALLRAEPNVKSNIKSNPTSDSKSANPTPPPRAAASTPTPGSRPLAKAEDPTDKSARAPAAEPSVPVHSELKKKLVRMAAKLMGYNSRTTTAIRVTSDLYDRCAERWDLDKEFWQGECHLPPTYQSWFQVTNIHVMLLLLRFRAMDPKDSAVYQQEIINHFFIDAEYRMRQRFGVQTSRLVKGYMKEMHTQHRGALLAVDEAVAMLGSEGEGDSRLAMALWRNVFGAGWGDVGGVLSKVRGIDKSAKGAPVVPGVGPVLAKDRGPSAEDPRSRSPYAAALAQQRQNAVNQGKVSSEVESADPLAAEHPELAFPIVLSRLTTFFLRELRRLAAISDHEVELGMLSRPSGPERPAPPKHIHPENVAHVGAGERAERLNNQPLGLDTQVETTRDGEVGHGEHQTVGQQSSIANFGRP